MRDDDLKTTHKTMPMTDGRTIHYYRNDGDHPALPAAVVITGGLGYIGQSLAYRLRAENQNVVVIDTREIQSQVDDLAVVHGSVGDAEVWEWIRARYRIATVYHCAGLISVSESVTEPARYFSQNVIEAIRMLDHLRLESPIPLIFSSSAAVYGTPETVPIVESAPKVPMSPYGATKLQFEQILTAYAAAYQMPWVALRYFNAAGYLGSVREHHQPETHVLPLMARAIQQGKPPVVFGTDYDTPDGSAIRDYIHVADLVDAHLRAAQYLEAGGPSIALNLGSGTGASVLELVQAFSRVSGRVVRPEMAPRRAGDPPRLVAGIDQAKMILHWAPTHSTVDAVVSDAWNAIQEEVAHA